MPIYEIMPDSINPLPETTFADAGLKERGDIQRLLRERIEIITPDTLLIAEEFGEWEDSRRRIDLLGLDQNANLVVIELKRTEDGGHMELQALRYAAMVSTMTFEQVTDIFGAYLRRSGSHDDPRTTILGFLGWDDPDEERFASEVRIVLASAAFSRELTTAVLWLNERGLDIRCVRLRPYRYGERLLLDVQHVIPLPEAADYQVRVRDKVRRERAARPSASNRDYTRYTVTTAARVQTNLPKRRAILEVVRGLNYSDIPVPAIRQVLQNHHRFGPRVVISAPGDLASDAFVEAISEQFRLDGRTFDPTRYFTGDTDLLRSGTHTFALTNQWGLTMSDTIDALIAAFPDQRISCIPVEAGS